MKRFIFIPLAVIAAVLLYLSSAWPSIDRHTPPWPIEPYSPGDAANGIETSRHNLASMTAFTGMPSPSSDLSTAVCVFCHTPHLAGLLNAGPAWGRGQRGESASFMAYGLAARGSVLSYTSLGSATLACLSCHDGVTTLDNIINAPGKGGVVVSSSSDFDWVWRIVTNIMPDRPSRVVPMPVNLSSDHPVSVPYDEHRAGLRPTDTVISEIDLMTDLQVSARIYDRMNMSRNYWSVKGYISTTARISDLLRNNNVECSSCHDPHFNNKSWNEVDYTFSSDVRRQKALSGGLFLRRVGGNTGSGICRTCHRK